MCLRYIGAPVDITPTKDDPALGADPSRNNNFRYDFPNDQQTEDRCPFAAHTRKTNPRADLEDNFGATSTQARRIIRRGVQFGPEVTATEAASGKTIYGRGLIFVAYQSNFVNGFQFVQECTCPTVYVPLNSTKFLYSLGERHKFSAQTVDRLDPWI